MLRRRLLLSIIPLLGCVLIGVWAFSALQRAPELPHTYISPDGSFTFHYPSGWYADTLSGGRVDLENTPYEGRLENENAVRLEISPPVDIASFSMLGQGVTPVDLVKRAIQGGNLAANFLLSASQQNQLSQMTGTPPNLNTVTDIPVVSFTVNGRPAAWASQSYNAIGHEFASMIVYVDFGGSMGSI